MNSTYLASWLLIYLNRIHTLYIKYQIGEGKGSDMKEIFNGITLTVENTLGLLQNISLKTVGVDKII